MIAVPASWVCVWARDLAAGLGGVVGNVGDWGAARRRLGGEALRCRRAGQRDGPQGELAK